MHTRTWAAIAAIVALLVPISCGSDDDATATSIPTPEQLGRGLLNPSDLTGSWEVNRGPADAEMPESGVISDEIRPMLPRMEFCDAASAQSRAADEQMKWAAFRQLNLTPDDPIALPDDRSGHMVFVQEFVMGADATTARSTFESLRDGMKACLGDIDTGEEGPGVAVEMNLPTVGDDRYGVLTTMQEAGGDAEWLLHNALVLKGTVLMLVDVVDIRMGVDPLFTMGDVGNIVSTAVGRL